MKRTVPIYQLYGEEVQPSPDFWLHCETIPSRSSLHRWEIRPHRHENFFQILYIVAGSGDAVFEDGAHAIRPPAVVTVPPGVGHGFRFSRDVDGYVFTMLSAHLKAAPGERGRLGEWLGAPRLTLLSPGDAEAAYVAETLQRLAREFNHRLAGRNDLLEAHLTTALTLTARLSAVQQESASADTNERRMEALHELVQRHFRSQQPASFYARQLGVSPTHLNRIVRSMTGRSVHELIARKLAEEAKRELVFSQASVKTVGLRLGFADPAYFSRFFARQTGRTPRGWREAERQRLGL